MTPDLYFTTAIPSQALLVLVVFALIYLYMWRLPDAPPGLGWWTLALVPIFVRFFLLTQRDNLDPSFFDFTFDVMPPVILAFYILGARAYVGMSSRMLPVVAFTALPAIWSYLSIYHFQAAYLIHHGPLSLLVGGPSLYIGMIFLKARQKEDNPGLTFAAWAFLIWGVHRIAFPGLMEIEGFGPWGFKIAQTLFLAMIMTLILVVHHRLSLRLKESERQLKITAEQLKGIIAASPVPMIALGATTDQILFYNDAATNRLIPKTPDPAWAGSSGLFDTATGTRFLQILRESRSIENYEALLCDTQGERFWASLSAAPFDLNGEQALLITIHDITERKATEQNLQEQAATDSLTGMFNRGHFFDLSQKELLRAQRYNQSISVIAVDLDHFKSINDQYGHDAGDCVLRMFSRTCIKPLRANDVLGRIGGEEFGITLPMTDKQAAMDVAERLRALVESTPLEYGNTTIRCTISAGVAEKNESDATVEDIIRRADRAMYKAKSEGRNRVQAAD